MAEEPYIIAGGGIAGLATALALAPAPTLLLERAAAFEEVGAGLQLGPNAVRALRKLGAWDAVEPFATSPPEIHIREGHSGKLLKRLPLGGSFQRTFGAPYRVAHRAQLHAALLAVARGKPGISIRTGEEVAAWRDAGTGVEVLTRAGAAIQGRFLFGCDGVNSALRRIAVPGALPADSGYTLHRALADVPPALSGIAWDCINLWLCPGAHLVHYPVGVSPKLNIVATVKNGVPLAQAHAISAAMLGKLLASAPAWLPWPGLYVEPLTQWRHGNMLLMGDAAHGTLPFLAQGAAMALEDAACLAPIAAAGIDAADAVWAERRRRTARLHRETMKAAARYHARGIHGLMRNAVIRLLPSALFSGGLSWVYSG